ncbi:MAG: hypothetical protein FJX31_00220 [Alphaproteobacteria bacterium]|nr:hypothetical protein [Alphaproteobacteria bacterium]
MDLSRALSDHQIALIRASQCEGGERREHLREVADQLADHIAVRQDDWGADCRPCCPPTASET